jgi:hypothetical protein
MTFRANKNGTWVGGDDQSAGTTVYGKFGGNWLYAKEVFANKNGTWERAWTDCRKFDEAGGRDWSSSSQVFTDSTGCDGCGTKSKTVVTYTKTGCPNDVRDPGYGGCSDSWSPGFFDPFTNVYPLVSGSFPYVKFGIFGGRYYTDSTGTVFVSCGGGTLLGPVDVEYCSVSGDLRAAGGDTCYT